MADMKQSFEAGQSEAQLHDQAGHAAEAVQDAASAAADSGQMQMHRAAETVQEVRPSVRPCSISFSSRVCQVQVVTVRRVHVAGRRARDPGGGRRCHGGGRRGC